VLARHGLHLLRNDRVDIGGLQLIGLEDYWGPSYDPAPVLAGLPPGAPAVVLSHNPDTADEPVWGAFNGWILAGHTHGGQCKPPFLPPPLVPVRNRRYTAGAFAVGGGRSLYINRGLGHLIRVRFNARPEITVFTLTRAA
jgi:predicted MPP superfamily phosphohydrolase